MTANTKTASKEELAKKRKFKKRSTQRGYVGRLLLLNIKILIKQENAKKTK